MLIESFILEKLTNNQNNNNSNQNNPTPGTSPTPTSTSTPTPTLIATSGRDLAAENRRKIMLAILNIILSSIAAYLAWNCNLSEKP